MDLQGPQADWLLVVGIRGEVARVSESEMVGWGNGAQQLWREEQGEVLLSMNCPRMLIEQGTVGKHQLRAQLRIEREVGGGRGR